VKWTKDNGGKNSVYSLACWREEDVGIKERARAETGGAH